MSNNSNMKSNNRMHLPYTGGLMISSFTLASFMYFDGLTARPGATATQDAVPFACISVAVSIVWSLADILRGLCTGSRASMVFGAAGVLVCLLMLPDFTVRVRC